MEQTLLDMAVQLAYSRLSQSESLCDILEGLLIEVIHAYDLLFSLWKTLYHCVNDFFLF